MAEILGKITSSYEIPRGADVSLRIRIPESWLLEGRTIEVELPRHLTCARCQGGGCDTCGQSGAITLRGKTELPEVVQVFLPLQRAPQTSTPAPIQTRRAEIGAPNSDRSPDSQPSSARPVVIRIPECGGLPDAGKQEIVRGMLLLEITTAAQPSSNVCLLEDDEPMSSSKMLRAEIRPHEIAQASPARGAAPDPARPRPDVGQTLPRHPSEAIHDSQPPSSRVARVSYGDANRLGSMRGQEPARPRRTAKASLAIYVALVGLAALGLLALLLL